jgi:signal peptidase I
LVTKRKNTSKKKKSIGSGKGWFKAFIIACLFILLCKVFLFEPYIVNSSNMGRAVLPGEIVVVGKSNYGARLPITLLSLPFFGYTNYLDWIILPAKRLPGFDSLKRFDLILFNLPYEKEKPIDKRQTRFSRILGMPGENIEIKNYRCFVDKKLTDIQEQNIFFKYSVEVESESVFKQVVDKYAISEGSITKKNTYLISISGEEAKLINTEKGVNKVVLQDNSRDERDLVFNPNQQMNWNKKNFGPIEVPFKGKKITLNKTNLTIYSDIISFHENNDVIISGSSVMINGTETNEYTFKNNYYFVLDDNRSDGNDSRYWGFLPETHIVGKSLFVLFPAGKDGLREKFSRFFQRTN